MANNGNKVKYGLKNLYVAFMTDQMNDDGLPTYETPEHVCGAATMSLSSKVERTSVAADDEEEYYSVVDVQGYEGDVEITYIPDTILARMMGHKTDAKGGIIVNKDDQPVPFAMMCEWSGDVNKKRTVYYNCIAEELPEDAAESGKKPKNDKLKIKARPLSETGDIKYSVKSNDTTAKTVYDSFFTAVQFPDASAS